MLKFIVYRKPKCLCAIISQWVSFQSSIKRRIFDLISRMARPTIVTDHDCTALPYKPHLFLTSALPCRPLYSTGTDQCTNAPNHRTNTIPVLFTSQPHDVYLRLKGFNQPNTRTSQTATDKEFGQHQSVVWYHLQPYRLYGLVKGSMHKLIFVSPLHGVI